MSSAGDEWTLTTLPIGTPATYGASLREPQLTTSSPTFGETVWSTRLSSSVPSPDRLPSPSRKPSSIDSPRRPPIVDLRSTMSSTVAEWRVASMTRPTRPSALTTVRSGTTPSAVPRSIVTVRENDCAEPIADDLGVDDAVAATCRRARRCPRPRRPGCCSPTPTGAGPRAACWWPRALRCPCAGRRRSRKWSGMLVIGRSASLATFSTGPRTLPAAVRSGSTGETDVSCRASRVMIVTEASTSRPRTVRDRPGSGVIVSASARRRAPAGGPRTPRRTCPLRARPSRAGLRPRARACRSRGAAARRGRGAGRRRRSGPRRGP